jgi:hypothetical protein
LFSSSSPLYHSKQKIERKEKKKKKKKEMGLDKEQEAATTLFTIYKGLL